MTATVAKLICDGSLDGNDGTHHKQKGTLLGGYAGGIDIDAGDDNYLDFYTASVPGLPNSSFVEIRAIEHGLFRLRDMINTHQLNVDTLTIYTDSMDAVDNFNRLVEDPNAERVRFRKPINRLVSRIRAMGIENVSFEHVKGHVDNKIATPIERMHNVVDRGALAARWQAQDHAFDPEGVVESPFYGVILDSKVSPSDAIKLREFAYNMSMKGMVARVVFEGPRMSKETMSYHPFMEGLAQASAEKGVKMSTLWNNCRQYTDDEMTHGVVGFDEVYVNRYYFEQGKQAPKDVKASSIGRNAAAAARAFMGPGVRQIFNERSNTGRMEPPSQAVFNFGSNRLREPGDLVSSSSWANTFAGMINMHHDLSLDNAMNYAKHPDVRPLRHPFSEFFSALNEVSDNMEPEQITGHLVNNLESKGFTVSSRLRDIISTQAYSWVDGGDKELFYEAMTTKAVNLASEVPYYPHPSQLPTRPEPQRAEPEAPRETLSLTR